MFFSQDPPNLAMFIPAMDHINNTLTSYVRPDTSILPVVLAALCMSKKTLNKYYKISNMSATYGITMGEYC